MEDLYIPRKFDFTKEAERQNWLELERWAARLPAPTGSPTLYDAVIDPNALSNNAKTHIYQNLAGVVANEPGWTSAKTMAIAVIKSAGGNLASLDAGPVVLPGPATLIGLGGFSGQYPAGPWNSGISYAAMEFNASVTSPNNRITFMNLMIFNNSNNSFSLFGNSSTTRVAFYNCNIGGVSNGASTGVMQMGSAGDVFAQNTNFYSIWPAVSATTNYFFDCSFEWGKLGNVSVNGGFTWIGGIFGVTGTVAGTLTLNGTQFYMDTSGYVDTGWSSGVGGGLHDLNIVGGDCYMRNNDSWGNVLVVPAAGNVYLDLSGVSSFTAQAPTSNWERFYKIAVRGGGGGAKTDVTGPCHLELDASSNAANSIILRGKSVNARCRIECGVNPVIQAIGLTDSTVIATFEVPGTGAQAYTLDANTKNNVFILTGHQNANFSTASTDAGVSNTIYDDQGVHAHGRTGFATMAGGTVVVANTLVTANSRIMLTVQALGTVAVPKAVAATARVAGTSFTITSADATDTSVVAWELLEP